MCLDVLLDDDTDCLKVGFPSGPLGMRIPWDFF
jgi:hypothetical protein